MPTRPLYTTIDEYIAATPPAVRPILKEIRATIRKLVPDAEERISYRMPAFFRGGVVVYFAAFQKHIGIYPPVQGDEKLAKDLARYRGPKGNLQFPLDEPIPYGLIRRVVRARVKELTDRASYQRKSKR